MGSALRGSAQISCFLTEVFFGGTPGNLLLHSEKCQGVPFSPICQNEFYFCSGPINVNPSCPQPNNTTTTTTTTTTNENDNNHNIHNHNCCPTTTNTNNNHNHNHNHIRRRVNMAGVNMVLA